MTRLARQSSSYGQGLVLGLTMAEVMLLLVFCLLLALAVLLSKQRDELQKAEARAEDLRKDLAQATLARASANHFAQILESNPQFREGLNANSASSNSAEISEFWRKLVDSEAVVRIKFHSKLDALDKLARAHGIYKDTLNHKHNHAR